MQVRVLVCECSLHKFALPSATSVSKICLGALLPCICKQICTYKWATIRWQISSINICEKDFYKFHKWLRKMKGFYCIKSIKKGINFLRIKQILLASHLNKFLYFIFLLSLFFTIQYRISKPVMQIVCIAVLVWLYVCILAWVSSILPTLCWIGKWKINPLPVQFYLLNSLDIIPLVR